MSYNYCPDELGPNADIGDVIVGHFYKAKLVIIDKSDMPPIVAYKAKYIEGPDTDKIEEILSVYRYKVVNDDDVNSTL